jgi:hypothetical protein
MRFPSRPDWVESGSGGASPSSSSSIRYFGPSGSSYWPLRTDQRKASQAPIPSASEIRMRKASDSGQPFPARGRRRMRSEFSTTKVELAAMAPAATMGCSAPAMASGTAATL